MMVFSATLKQTEKTSKQGQNQRTPRRKLGAP